VILDELGGYKGYEMRGAGPARFHRCATEGGWPFCVCVNPVPGKPPRGAYIFESAIDALSLWTIREGKLENVLLASTHGIANTKRTVDILKRAYGFADEQVCLCLDNDEAGSACMDGNPQWKSIRVKDPYKDWNELLVGRKECARTQPRVEAPAEEPLAPAIQDEAPVEELLALAIQDESDPEYGPESSESEADIA
jgi:hypothetical protein